MNTKEFKQSIIEKIGYYVYFLQDPRNDEVFYVGKGVGNRVFAHLACAIDTDKENQKLDRIREINKSGYEVKHYILRHGLNESTAFEVEAAMIDFLGRKNITNFQGGHHSTDFGLLSCEELVARYEAPPLDVQEPLMLINVNKAYRRDMSDNELYEVVRKWWVVGERKNKCKYAVATYKGLTREVYEIKKWEPCPTRTNRWGFVGKIAPEIIRQKYQYKSIEGLFEQGAANPIKYLKC